MQITRVVTNDKHSQAASFTQARTNACVLARQLQDSQRDIKELVIEVADWQKVASETTAQLQQRDSQVTSQRVLLHSYLCQQCCSSSALCLAHVLQYKLDIGFDKTEQLLQCHLVQGLTASLLPQTKQEDLHTP